MPYKLRSENCYERCPVYFVFYSTDHISILSYLQPKIWDLVPNEIKQINSLKSFKLKIKKWIPKCCPCRLCKRYI